ncbi:hypothetical protein [Flavobacterium sp.]|uniref:hypothetical protein n=1 Tax=Flavobacterium sp. TaxID=239 RepID=UPI002B5D69E5|nr:hypothetical protein [Flavobacterium sp.]HSD08286.1 hypothetical protein [Flavobacterium sp.]
MITYKFHTKFEEDGFYWNLNKCMIFFKEADQEKKDKIIKSSIRSFQLGVLNHRNGKTDFIKKLNYDYQMIYSCLNAIYDEKLYEFSEEELSWFRD